MLRNIATSCGSTRIAPARRAQRMRPHCITRLQNLRLGFEPLESRLLLAADWQNPLNSFDVTDAGVISPVAPLLVINDLQDDGPESAVASTAPAQAPPPQLDVSGDDVVTADDAMMSITALDRRAQRRYSNQAVNASLLIERSELVNVDADTDVAYSRFIFNRRTGQMSAHVSVTNTSASTLSTPLILVIESISTPAVTVANADGMTTDGKPFFDLTAQVPGGSLDPGESTSNRTIIFNNPTRVRFTIIESVNVQVVDLPPTVTITTPTSGSTIVEGSTIPFEASASDDIGVAQVEFFVDGVSVFVDTIAPYATSFTVPASPDPLSLSATATDTIGQTTTELLSVSIDNPPHVTITAPGDGDTVTPGDSVTFSATATDDVGVAQVEFFVDGVSVAVDSSAPYGTTFVVPASPSPLPLSSIVTDTAGLTGSDSLSITIQSVGTPPTAVNDGPFDVTGNVGIDVPAGLGVFFNDTLGTPAATISVFDATSANNGSVTMNATDGAFTYTPAPGFEGSDSFTYTLQNPSGTSGATVSLNVSDMIWFIDASAGGGGDGRLNSPFDCLSGGGCFDLAAADDPGDNIFLAAGSYSGGNTLLNNQALVGQGATGASLDAVLGITLPTFSNSPPAINGTNPVITSGSDGMQLGSGNTIRGLTIGNTTGAGIAGTNFGTLTVSETTINGSGQALDLNTGTLAATFDQVSSSSSGTGIELDFISGALSITTGTISAASGRAVDIGGNINGSGGNATINIGVSINNTAGDAIFISELSGGSVSLSGNISHNAFGKGIRVRGINNGTAATVTFSGSDIDIESGGSHPGIDLGGSGSSSNPNGTINFTGGDLDITTFGGIGLSATGGGTVNVSGAGNSIQSATGIALRVEGTDIGASGLTFRSISANGATNGIVLDNTGTAGGLTVTGDGSTATQGGNDTGGIIQNTSGDGIVLTDTGNITLRNMTIGDTTATPADSADATSVVGDDGIHALRVVNLTLNNVTIARSETHGVRGIDVTNFTLDDSLVLNAGDEQEENGLDFTELRGDNFITDSLFDAFNETGIEVTNTSGTVDLTISNTTFQDNQSTVGNAGEEGILLQAQGTATIIAKVTNGSTFDDLKIGAIQGTSNGTSSNLQLTVENSFFVEENSADGVILFITDNSGSGNITVSGNTFNDDTVGPVAVNLKNDSTGTLQATVDGNVVNDMQLLLLRHDDIGSGGSANGTTIVKVNNNNATSVPNGVVPLDVIATESGPVGSDRDVQLTVTNNTLSFVNSSAFFFTPTVRMLVQNNTRFNLEMTGNTLTDDSAGSSEAIRLDQEDSSAFRIEGLVGSASTFLASNNTILSGLVIANGTYTAGNANDPAPTTMPSPLMAVSEGSGAAAHLDADALAPIVTEAISRLADSGLADAQLALLNGTDVTIRDLPSSFLGYTSAQGHVIIDSNAAGHGWFVDMTPSDDAEFNIGTATAGQAAARIDLLTVVMHELSHILGQDHSADAADLRAGELVPGTRRLPEAHDAIFADVHAVNDLAFGDPSNG